MSPIPYQSSALLLLASVVLSCSQADDDQTAANVVPPTPASPVLTAVSPAQKTHATPKVKEIEWDELIPEQWRPDKLMAEYNTEELADEDPRAQELYEKLRVLWDESPVVPTLEGQRLKLPGFVVPLEMDAEKIAEFLLVPYYGACIHAPPPPANQTIHVVTGPGQAFEGQAFDTVWVTGTMRVESHTSELAQAGYRLEDANIAPYDDPPGGADAP